MRRNVYGWWIEGYRIRFVSVNGFVYSPYEAMTNEFKFCGNFTKTCHRNVLFIDTMKMISVFAEKKRNKNLSSVNCWFMRCERNLFAHRAFIRDG